ncbi:hypothetical protein [Algoriphagus halophytocola]|uniref:Uncharacterized protein n=1 Tax=Algoriphagus halophytocola TaxID=2991499 RepID=A0ABY6ML37_9BACT|nr:hypothetical protein [Algoriphagus sp. TR-M5]UZD22991.1 hypothetical protein OM944_00555 [Algoriphagus sp. TR-M5]
MKHSRTLYLHLLCFAILFSCAEKEQPSGELGKLSITALTLAAAPPMTNAKINTDYTWEHELEESLSLQFTHSITSESYFLQINPNDFGSPYEISLPYGSYQISGETPVSSPSPTLPLKIDSQVQVNSSSTPLVLEGETDFGLATFSGSSIQDIEVLVESERTEVPEKDGIFYSYLQQGELAKIEIKLVNGKIFRQLVNPEAFTQYHYDIISSEGSSTAVISESFEIKNYTYPLSATGLPSFLAPAKRFALPESSTESSGLAFIQGRLFTINDSGNSNEILEINPDNGELIRKVKVQNVENVDWEDLAQSPTHLFIGDFGNNSGNRKDLAVHKIAISDLLNAETVLAETIPFNFSDQTDFTSAPNQTAFDCESMVYRENKLYLFTKNWLTGGSSIYMLKVQPEVQEAALLGTLEVQGLLTGADVDAMGNLVLLGYEQSGLQSSSLLWIIAKADLANLTLSGGKKLLLGSPAILSQTEGVVFVSEKELYISGEKISIGPATVPGLVHILDLRGYIGE